jgi:hypothetical protein
MTALGIEPATFRFVAQCLDRLRHRVTRPFCIKTELQQLDIITACFWQVLHSLSLSFRKSWLSDDHISRHKKQDHSWRLEASWFYEKLATHSSIFIVLTSRCVMRIEWSIDRSKQTTAVLLEDKNSFLFNHATCFGLWTSSGTSLSVLQWGMLERT